MSLVTKTGASLFEVIDPELGVNIMDLGLIYGIVADDEDNVTIRMTLTTPGCPMHDSITRGVKRKVNSIDGVNEVNVNLVWEPRWTPDKMSDQAKKMLGMA
ncbi:MAG TPA: iron-sulfur cluster assembly protein [Bacillota bacterium]|nr:iron-sulfur cluster assembly protein [Bacillota bacterium]